MPISQVQFPDGKVVDVEHPESVGDQDVLSYAFEQYTLDPSIAYDLETSLFDDVVEFGQRTLGSAATQLAQVPSGLQERFFGEEGFGEDDQALVERNRRAAQSIADFFGYDEGYEGGAVEFLSGAIGGALPSYGTALAGAGAGLLFGGPVGALVGGGLGLLGASAIGAGANVSAGMEETARAVELGRIVSDENYEDAMRNQALIGLSEGLPLGRLFGPVLRSISKTALDDPKAVRTLTDYIVSALKQGSLEAAQEATAGLASNANLKEYINPDIGITDSLASDLGAGGIAGAFFDVALNLATRKSRLAGLGDPDEAKPLPETLVAAEQELRDGIDAAETARRERLSERLGTPVEVEADPEVIGASLNSLLDQDEPTADDYKAFGQGVVAQLGDSFPTEPVFEIVQNEGGNFQIQDTSGQTYGREVTPQEKIKLQPALVALNAQTVEESIFQNNRMVINESPEDYSPDQVRTLHRLGRIALGPESLSYSAEAANYAGGTVPEKGFLPSLSPQEIIKNNIPRKQQTIAQRINVRRLKNNQPTTNRFALSEIRREIGSDVGRLADYESGTFRVSTFRALPFPVEGKFAVVPEVMNVDGQMEPAGDYIFDRPATAVERQAAREQGRRPPKRVKFVSAADASNYASESNRAKDEARIPLKEIMGDPEFSVEKIRRILDQKNIASDVNSQEIKQLASLFTGNKLRKDQAINDLTPAEGQLFYLKLSQLPRFDQPTKIPQFKLLPYTANQIATAKEYYQANGKDISRAELEYISGKPMTDSAYKMVTRRASQVTPPAQADQEPVAALPPPSIAPDTKQMLADAVNRRLKALGLSDISGVVTDLVRSVERDADGNVYLNNVAEGADERVEGGYQRSGAKTIQVALDAIMSRAKKPEDIESAVIDVLNHEIVHALRELDVITQQELQLLERLTTKYRKPDTNQTYAEWAAETYAGDTAVNISEEAVAEMIRDGISGRIIIDNKPAKLSGKPRSIFNRIVKFFKGLFNTAKEADPDYESFTQFITDLESGAIGERQRGQVRTLYRLEQVAGEFINRRGPVVAAPSGPIPKKLKVLKEKIPESDSLMEEAGIDDMMFSRRLVRAEEQGFDTNTVYFHGSMSPDIKRFKARTGMGVVAGHFTRSPALANTFVAGVARAGEAATVYPVFLRKFIADNETGKSLFAVREAGEAGALQNIADSLDKPFAVARFDHPQLFQDLTDYFKGQLELAKQSGSVEGTKLRYGLSQSIAQEYVRGKISLDEAAYDIAENFHENAARNSFRQVEEEPNDVDFEQLEVLAPYIKEAGFAGYRDIEEFNGPYSAIALFDPADVKGVFAEYDPTAVPKGMEYADDIMFSRRSAVDMFEPSAFNYIGATGRETLDPKQINPAHKARHTIVDMPIDMFLGLAQVGEGASKTKGVQDLVERGVKFSELPMLTTRPVGHREKDRQLGLTKTALIVTGHEGRHRARALKAAGYDTMPVRIFDDVIRWGEQSDPKSFDYLPYWPEEIIAQADINRKTDPSRAGYEPRGLYTYPMFISRDGRVDFEPATERPSVIFEVAPDPRNTPLLEQWNSLPEPDKLRISEEVARAVAPQVLAEVSASGEVVSQVGSYKNETNPSFAVRLSSGDPTDAASVLGFVLQQESMMIVSPRPYEGAQSRLDPDLGTETRSIPAIFIKVGDKSQAEIAQIYDTLRTADGAPEFSGQSTIDGNMMILLDGSPDVDAAIEAFDRALNRQYDIDNTVVFSSFPQAKDYNYETEVLNTRVSPEGARRRLNNVRAEVQAEVKRRVQESRNRLDRRSNRGDILERLSGAVRPNGQLSLTHYSNKPIQRTDPSRAGTGADRTRRLNRVSSATYLGITEANINPYVREPMLGNVANRFEVDPFSLYDLDRNTEGLAKKNANGSWDLDGTLKAVSEAGYIGFWTDNPTLGKVALVTEPLDAINDKPDDDNQTKFSRRQADRNVERSSQDAVNKVLKYAESVKLDPAGAATLEQGPLAFSINAGFADQNGYAPSFTTPSRSWFDRVVFQVQDKLTDLKAIEEAINEARKARGEPPLAIQESAYIGEETIAGKLGEFDRRFQRNELQPLIDDMSASGVSLDQMDEFLVLRHAIERNERVRRINPAIPDAGSGEWNGQKLTDNYVKTQMLAKYGMRWNDKKGEWEGGNDRAKTMSRLASQVDKINSTTLAISERGGLLTKQDREFLDGFFKYYTPLRGIAQDEDIAAETNKGTAGSGGSLSIVGKEVKRLMGRQTEAISPFATIVSDRGRQTARAVKNVSFGRRLVDLVKNNPNDDVWQLISPEDPRYKRAFDTSYTYVGPDKSRYGERKSDISKEGDKKNWVKRVRVIQDPVINPYGQELLGVKVDGEQYYVHFVNPSLRKAAINLDAESVGYLVEKLNGFTRFMSYVNTSLNPEFVMGNFARDVQTAVYNIVGEQTMEGGKAVDAKKIVGQVLKRTLPSIKVFYKGYRDPSSLTGQDAIDFREFMQTGAKTDWFHSKPPEQQKKNIERMVNMANGTFSGNATQGVLAVKDFIDDSNAAVENGVRLATFVAARDAMLAKGIDRDTAVQQAATLAKNLTVNFNRRGNSGQLLNGLYLFFNASVQGTVNTLRGMNVFDPNSSRTKQAIVGGIIGFGALMAALAESLMDEEELEDIPEYIRDRNMIIPDALWGGDPKKYSTVPLPYGYNVFYNLGENAYLVSSGALSKEDAAVRATNVFLGSFNPLGTSSSETYIGSLLKTAMPQIAKPVLELAMNENYFGAPIYPPDNPFGGFSEPLSRRSFKNTAPLWKNIAEGVSTFFGGNESESGAIEFPPDAMSYLVGYFGGGAGTFAERTFLKVPAALLDETAELEVRDIPFVRRIRGEINAQPDTEQYYERRETLSAKLNQANKVLKGAERAAYMKQNAAFFKMVPASKAAEKALKNLRASLREIQRLKAISPERAIELAQQEKRLQDRIDTVIEKFNNRYDQVVGKNK